MALPYDTSPTARLTDFKVLLLLLVLVFMSIQGLDINTCLDVSYQSSWEILTLFLLELKHTTLSNLVILQNRIQVYR